jgi:hypothetical protein
MSTSRAEDRRFAGGSRPAAISGTGCGYFLQMNWKRKGKSFIRILDWNPSATVTPGLDFFLCFQELNEKVLLRFRRVIWLSVVR